MAPPRTRAGNSARSLRNLDLHERPRTPGVTYAVLSVALAVLVGVVALTSRESPPPTIAEFAPQAVDRISDPSADSAPGERATSGNLSTSAGGLGERGLAPQTVDVARVRRCVGDPPRQIEDPQSPPCVSYWAGDNGGATWRGVTRDEIHVAASSLYPALQAFFNRRFEFYGRRIRFVMRAPAYDGGAGDRAAARAAYEQDQVFAATHTAAATAQAYFDELARFGIVGVTVASFFPEAYLAAHRPFLWAYPMANDRMFATAGNWYCARLAGRNAAHAGDPVLQLSRRKAGIILTSAGREGTSAEPMSAQLASCGERVGAMIVGTDQTYDLGYYAAFMENAMLQMKTAGVTTVACLCDANYLVLAMPAATNQGYFPEWLLTSYLFGNESVFWVRALGAHEQLKSTMLLLAHPMQRPYPDHPSNWATQEADPSGYPRASNDQWYVDLAYQSLLLLASGLQMAGPRLTPETFERGLHRARFLNPVHRIMAGSVGFADGDHSMTDDVAEMWWSTAARNPYGEAGGTFCYVDGGARRRIGTFPSGDPFFNGPCDNGSV